MSQPKGHLCNAGVNAASILPDGSVNVCYDRQGENLGNIFSGFGFRDKLVDCKLVHCACPLWAFEKNLYQTALGNSPENSTEHQVFFHWHITYECQMMCEYCIVTGPDKLTDTRDKLRKSPPCDVDAILKTMDQMNLIGYFSLMGGETFLVPNINEVCAKLTEKHYLGANTNLCAMDPNFWKKVNVDHLGNFHISLHVGPMERKGLTQKFIENHQAMVESGFKNFYVTVVGHPEIFPKLQKYREFFGEYGIEFKIIPMIEGGLSTGGKLYPESYTEEELQHMERDWLEDYFPENKAKNVKTKIEQFRAGAPSKKNHMYLEGSSKSGKNK